MRRNKKLTFMLVLVILVMCLTVGYAVLSTNLNINGTSTIGNARWDIHFENIVPTGTVQPTTAAQINAAGNTITYAVSLSKPGDFYEFMVDVRNAGTIDGMVESITSKLNNNPITTLPAYLEYYVTYADDIPIEENHLLAANSTEKYVVHIGFKEDINASDLPGSAQTFNMSFSVIYTQATSDAVAKPVYKYSNYGSFNYVGDALFEVNNTAPSAVALYNSYSEIPAGSTGNIFLKHIIRNNIVLKSYPGYAKDGQEYVIEATQYSELTQQQKNMIKGLFGSENCSDNGISFTCSIPNTYMGFYASSNGIRVDGIIENWGPSFCTTSFGGTPNVAACSMY